MRKKCKLWKERKVLVELQKICWRNKRLFSEDRILIMRKWGKLLWRVIFAISQPPPPLSARVETKIFVKICVRQEQMREAAWKNYLYLEIFELFSRKIFIFSKTIFVKFRQNIQSYYKFHIFRENGKKSLSFQPYYPSSSSECISSLVL